MVNYLYDLDTIEKHHEAYRQSRRGDRLERGAAGAAAPTRRAGRRRPRKRPSSTDGQPPLRPRPLAACPDADRPFAELADGRRYTYGDVDDVSARFANALVDLGVEPGDRVAVQVEKSIEAIMLYLGAIRAGAVFLPLNTAYTPAEIEYFLGDAEPRVFVCDPAQSRGAAADRGEGRRAARDARRLVVARRLGRHARRRGRSPPRPASTTSPRGPDDLAAILYTSGTTGRSKGAMLTHDNLASNAATLARLLALHAGRRADPRAADLPHPRALRRDQRRCWSPAPSMIFLPKFDPDEIFEVLPRATAMMGVPTFYTRLLQDPRLTAEATAHMRLFVSGSAPLLAETHREWQARTGHAILERYGMTETNMNTSNPYDGERIAGTVGFPLPGRRAPRRRSGDRRAARHATRSA